MLNSTAPTTKEGIEKYLGSGMVKGIASWTGSARLRLTKMWPWP